MADDDIERARELAEERAYEAMEPGTGRKRVEQFASRERELRVGATSKLVRSWALAELVPDAILRMAAIGMGQEKFDVPTMAGNVVRIPAPASVQRAALHDLIAIGLPAQMGLVGDDGDPLPGVIALGAYEMAQVQQRIHAAHAPEVPDGPDGLPPKATGGYELPAGHELVTVDEGIGAASTVQEDRAPDPITDEVTLEQQILERHRERMRATKHKPLSTQPNPLLRSLTDGA